MDAATYSIRQAAMLAIHDTVNRYAMLAKEDADWAAIARLFTSDGSFVLPNGPAVPPDQVQRVVGNRPPVFIRHHLTTVVVDFTSEDEADVNSYFIAYSNEAQPDHWGRWRDVLRAQSDGRWLFVRKEPIVEGYAAHGRWAARVKADAR